MKTLKAIHLIWLLFIFGTVNGQTSNWSLGLSVAPQTYFNNKTIETSEYLGYEVINNPVNFNAGLLAQYQINNRFSFIMGANYSTKDSYAQFYCHVCGVPYIAPENLKIRYIEIPLIARYQLTEGKFALHAQFGFTAGVITPDSQRYPKDWLSITLYEPYPNLSDFNLSTQLGVGINYELSERIEISATGFYNQGLLFHKNFNYQSVGIEFGVAFKLGGKK